MDGRDKPLVWLAGEIKSPPFSEAALFEAGMLLRRLQRGELLAMPMSRPMPSIGKRRHELRIVDETATWRIVYRLEEDAVVVLDIFSKKTTRTPRAVLDVCKDRLKRYLKAAKED